MKIYYDKLWRLLKDNKMQKKDLASAAELSSYTMTKLNQNRPVSMDVIGSALINISIEWAKHKNLHGLMLETQDNNLIACKFYHNCGFKIGSVDTMLYANFENNFEKAVFWYLRF